MKKIIASLALAGALGAGLVGGAQAQTITSGTPGVYSLTITPNGGVLGGDTTNPTAYLYSYLVTLTTNTSGVTINTLSLNNIQGFVPGTQAVLNQAGARSSLAFAANAPVTSAGITTLQFVAPTGFAVAGTVPTTFSGTGSPIVTSANGDSAVFEFDSTLPPTGTVSFGTNGKGGTGNLAGTGTAVGPGPMGTPNIPEPSSFALLGLGMLPLGLMARRRLARNS